MHGHFASCLLSFVFCLLSFVFCLLSFVFCPCLCLCPCQQGMAGTGQSPRRDSQALCLTSEFLLSFVISCFSNSASRICLLEPWRRQAFAILASPEQSRRHRVGLPTPVKSQKTHRETLPWCSLPGTNSSHPRATSHSLDNRISKPAHRRSQPLHWTSHRMHRASTSQLGTIRHHSQATILTLPPSFSLNRLTLSVETMPRRDRTLPLI